MAIRKKTEIVLDHKFDRKSCRHYLNGKVSVMHCHHYATLYLQLAEDCGMLDGKALISEVAEDVFYGVLADYYEQHEIAGIDERVAIAEQYFAAVGLGKMEVQCLGSESGEVDLLHSHPDEGWIKKWGKRDKPINYIAAGYIAGMFAAVHGLRRRSFSVSETASIAMGDERSKFNVVIN